MLLHSPETLGDAYRARLQIYAHCRNYLCRHKSLVDVPELMQHVGAAHFLHPVRGQRHFSERLRCSECGNVGATIEIGERRDAEPVFEGLGISIEEWDFKGQQMQKLIARLGNIIIATAAYESALVEYPTRRILMRQQAHVLVDSSLRVIKGGKD